MNFTLSKEHQLAHNLFREFADKEVAPLAHEIDETERFPIETVEKMKKLGFLGIPYKKEYGGQGCDDLTYVLMMEQLGRVCGSTAIIASVLPQVTTISLFGSISRSISRDCFFASASLKF